MTRSGRGRSWFFLAVLSVYLLTAACSTGGGGNGGSGQVAGIEGTGIVSGFGSIYVDGIEFATEDARILFNGEPADESQLRAGDVVTVTGTIDASGSARATRVVFDRFLDGPISAIEIGSDGNGELRALGQTLKIDGDTHFVNADASQLKPGDLIAVSGLADDDATLRATSIERRGDYRPGVTRVDVEGTATELKAGDFRLGGLAVNTRSARIDTSRGALGSGAYVQVFGTRSQAADAPLVADTVIVRQRRLGAAGERVFVEGRIGRFNGPDDFSVAGQRVEASEAERIDHTDRALTAGDTVSVRGTRINSEINASTLKLEPEPTVTLRATLNGAVSAGTTTVSLLGTDWSARDDTLYIDRHKSGDNNDRNLRLDRLGAGDTVRVHGYRLGDGLVMTRLDRTRADPVGNGRIRGPIEGIDRRANASVIDVAGARVVARNGTTQYRDAQGQSIDAATFYAGAALGAVIDARGPANGGGIEVARELRLTD